MFILKWQCILIYKYKNAGVIRTANLLIQSHQLVPIVAKGN